MWARCGPLTIRNTNKIIICLCQFILESKNCYNVQKLWFKTHCICYILVIRGAFGDGRCQYVRYFCFSSCLSVDAALSSLGCSASFFLSATGVSLVAASSPVIVAPSGRLFSRARTNSSKLPE